MLPVSSAMSFDEHGRGGGERVANHGSRITSSAALPPLYVQCFSFSFHSTFALCNFFLLLLLLLGESVHSKLKGKVNKFGDRVHPPFFLFLALVCFIFLTSSTWQLKAARKRKWQVDKGTSHFICESKQKSKTTHGMRFRFFFFCYFSCYSRIV